MIMVYNSFTELKLPGSSSPAIVSPSDWALLQKRLQGPSLWYSAAPWHLSKKQKQKKHCCMANTHTHSKTVYSVNHTAYHHKFANSKAQQWSSDDLSLICTHRTQAPCSHWVSSVHQSGVNFWGHLINILGLTPPQKKSLKKRDHNSWSSAKNLRIYCMCNCHFSSN